MIVCAIDNVSRTNECMCNECYFLPPAVVVGLKNASYSTSEDVDDVEVCAIVESPNNAECPVKIEMPSYIIIVQ